MTEKLYDIIDIEEPRGQSVTYGGIPCTARTCVTSLNRLTEENKQLKQQLENCKDVNVRCCNEYSYFHKQMMKLEKENKQLKQQSEKKQKHIVHLENKIHRMRKSINRLEVLYHYRGQEGSFDVKEECYRLKQENSQLKECNKKIDDVKSLEKENEQLKKVLFEVTKDYLIETADISDKPYLEDEIEKE